MVASQPLADDGWLDFDDLGITDVEDDSEEKAAAEGRKFLSCFCPHCIDRQELAIFVKLTVLINLILAPYLTLLYTPVKFKLCIQN